MSEVVSERIVTLWVDPEPCIGCGQCSYTAPDVFGHDEDGFVRVLESPGTESSQLLPSGPKGVAVVPAASREAMRLAIKGCPGGHGQLEKAIFHLGSRAAESEKDEDIVK